uniref:Solute carrier family 5 member 8 n=2 Tax=Nothobranchius furzeri TaxID=105023 RepID=A0A8C6KRQ5_NOTFU
MSGSSQGAGSFGIADYAVFVLMLVVSAGIGVYYAWMDRSSGEFLTGGRTLTALPVSMSLTASIMSSVTLMSNPAEVYQYGAIFGLIGIAYTLSIVITSEIFLPVFYRLGITSIYEYLEQRFNKAARLYGTVTFIIQTCLYAGVMAYGPALALNRVIDMNLWIGITSTAIVCTFYCTFVSKLIKFSIDLIGIMLSGYFAVITKSVMVQGGISIIVSDSQQGGRLNFWDFDINPLRRNTFWTLVVGGTFVWSSVYGIHPAAVQRYISCKSILHARVAVYFNLLGLYACLISTLFSGLCLYSVYKNCDPWTAGLVSSPDQLMPHLVMEIFASNPGVPGLFLAAVYSGSLRLIYTRHNKSKKQKQRKKRGNFYINFNILAVIGSVTGGPLLGLFSLGMLCPFANSKGGLSGLVLGFVATLCVSIGDILSPSPSEMTRPLSLTTTGCNFTSAGHHNWTSTVPPVNSILSFTTRCPPSEKWHSPSYLYFCLIGAVTALTVGVIVSLLTGGRKKKVDPKLLLQKEDTTLCHLFTVDVGVVFLQVMVGAEELDLTEAPGSGNANPDFRDLGGITNQIRTLSYPDLSFLY